MSFEIIQRAKFFTDKRSLTCETTPQRIELIENIATNLGAINYSSTPHEFYIKNNSKKAEQILQAIELVWNTLSTHDLNSHQLILRCENKSIVLYQENSTNLIDTITLLARVVGCEIVEGVLEVRKKIFDVFQNILEQYGMLPYC